MEVRRESGLYNVRNHADVPSVNSIDDMMSVDTTEETTEAWQQELGDRVEEIINRKRSSVQGRELALAKYAHILMGHYAYDEIQSKTNELFPALLKSVKSESEKEASLALRGRNIFCADVDSADRS